MAVGAARFVRHRQAMVDGVPVETWVYPQDREAGLRAFAPAARVVGTFERRLGEYPYAKLANVQTTTRWGGLENAGNVFYDEDAVDQRERHRDPDRPRGRPPVVRRRGDRERLAARLVERGLCDLPHRLLPGLDVRPRDASWGRWTRRASGSLRYLEQAPDSVIVPEAVPDPRRLLSPNVYQKAAWVLHILRGEVGDGTFWKGMRTYYQRFRDRNASTGDFAAVMEEVSGRRLDWFFDQWLRRPGVPELEIEWSYDAAASTVEFDVRQLGPTIYRLPLDVEAVLADGSSVRGRVGVEGEYTTATVTVPGRPERLRIDPDGWLLMRFRAVEK